MTVRPKNGLHGEYDEKVIQWIRKQDYFIYNYEKEAEARHLHAQIFCDTARTKSDVQKALKRIAMKYDPDWDAASQKVLSQGVKIAYNDNFMDNYITKDNEIQMDYYNAPNNTEEYYPSEAEQKTAMERANARDTFFHSLKVLWDEYKPEYEPHQNTLKDIGEFIYDMMFVEKKISVITDDRRRKQTIKALQHYLFPYHAAVSEYLFTAEDQASINLISQMNNN